VGARWIEILREEKPEEALRQVRALAAGLRAELDRAGR